jgi:hypothetical protein
MADTVTTTSEKPTFAVGDSAQAALELSCVLRTAVVGAGFIRAMHARAIRASGGRVALVVVDDPHLPAAAQRTLQAEDGDDGSSGRPRGREHRRCPSVHSQRHARRHRPVQCSRQANGSARSRPPRTAPGRQRSPGRPPIAKSLLCLSSTGSTQWFVRCEPAFVQARPARR